MPCCKRICSSRSTTGSTQFAVAEHMRFATRFASVLRAAREHGDEFAVFELGEDVHFAKRLFERRHGRVDHLPGDRAAVFAVDDVEIFDLQIQDRERDAEAMAFGYASLEDLNERGAGRRLLARPMDRPRSPAAAGGSLRSATCSASVIGTWLSPVCQWPQLRPAFFDV